METGLRTRPTCLAICLISLCLVATLLCGCFAVTTRSVYSPVYLSYDVLRRSVAADTSSTVELSNLGKIYVKDDYLYVNELYKGIHVIDNSDPANPAVVAFIPIPGNVDMAICGTVLYADSYVDLVAIDVSNPIEASEINRIEDAFPYADCIAVEPWYDYLDEYESPDEGEGVVVAWLKTDEEVFVYNTAIDYALEGAAESSGTGGSMARFTVVGDYLYALHEDSIRLVDVSEPAAPELLDDSIYVGWDIETIFPYEDKLFIGSTTGMYIFDNSAPPAIEQLSVFAHVTSCDPVVVEAGYAYVTLRAGSSCGGLESQLQIIDVSDAANPELVASHALEGPYGLAADGSTLFVCDGEYGLKVFDVSDPTAESLTQLASVTGYQTYDVILLSGVAIVVGPDALYEYDTTGLTGETPTLTLLSEIEVTPSDDGSAARSAE